MAEAKSEAHAALLARQRDEGVAFGALTDLRDAFKARYHELTAPAEKALQEAKRAANESAHAEFDDRIRAAELVVRDAEKLVAEARAAHETEQAARDFYPVGTRLRRWEPRRSWGGSNGGWRRTDEIGVVQVYRKGDPLPGNIAAYSHPNDGAVIIRIIRQNGSVGTKFYKPPHYDPKKEWLPADAINHPGNARAKDTAE